MEPLAIEFFGQSGFRGKRPQLQFVPGATADICDELAGNICGSRTLQRNRGLRCRAGPSVGFDDHAKGVGAHVGRQDP